MDFAIDLSDASKALDLANIRFQLIRLEDTIIFHLIERAQFPLNHTIYVPGALNLPGTDLSLLDWMLRETERTHSLVRRYESPDEQAFFSTEINQPMLQPLDYPHILHPNDVSVNDLIKDRYINQILPATCKRLDREDRGEKKENYGSTAVCDVAALQALSRRIHFGKFVAESKFLSETETFVKLIKAEDRKGIDKAITNEAVEAKVLERLRIKAEQYAKDPFSSANSDSKIDADAVVTMYKDMVIPLTKVVEVEYLMQRLEGTK